MLETTLDCTRDDGSVMSGYTYLRELSNKGNNIHKPTITHTKNKGPFMQNKKINLWVENNIKTVEVDTLKDNKTVDEVAFFYNNKEHLDETDKVKIRNGLEFIKDKYKLRCSGNAEDTIFTYINLLIKNKTIYLPFKKYNSNVGEAAVISNNEKAFGVVKGMYKTYDKLPGYVRAMNACVVDMICGDGLDNKVKFILFYSKTGVNKLEKNTDFSALGTLSFPLRLASKLQIPTFNIYNEGWESKLNNYLGSTFNNSLNSDTKETITQVANEEDDLI